MTVNSTLKRLFEIVTDHSTVWVVAAVLQLVSNILLEEGNTEEATNFGIAASVFWILATLRFTHQLVKPESVYDYTVNLTAPALLIGSCLFLASYLVTPDPDTLITDLAWVWSLAFFGALFFVVAAGNTLLNEVTPDFWIPLGAFCFVVGAALTMVSMYMNITTKTSPADLKKSSLLPYLSAVFLVIGALSWFKPNILPPSNTEKLVEKTC